ncbi:MAG: segregation/condensation protein A [Synechococcaceae cyanobacterium SM2_3_1]|nr:segregation/condensation protein A [Synechococcaceae cyanobacterium SM2_3_1]
MTAVSVTEAAIDLLLELAERGDIDPWDVEVIEVIDRFLIQLAPRATTQDLTESGQAFLYAAMLVYLKAMALSVPTDDDSDSEEELLPNDEAPIAWPPRQLDQVLQTRAVPRLARTRPITLKELIQHLQDLETLLHQRPEAEPKPPQKRLSRKQALEAITELAHPENLLETTAELESLLAQLWQQGIAKVEFEELLIRMNGDPVPEEEHDVKPHRIQIFWSLLLMASRSQVELHQEEFYQDLHITPYIPAIPQPEHSAS